MQSSQKPSNKSLLCVVFDEFGFGDPQPSHLAQDFVGSEVFQPVDL